MLKHINKHVKHETSLFLNINCIEIMRPRTLRVVVSKLTKQVDLTTFFCSFLALKKFFFFYTLLICHIIRYYLLEIFIC